MHRTQPSSTAADFDERFFTFEHSLEEVEAKRQRFEAERARAGEPKPLVRRRR